MMSCFDSGETYDSVAHIEAPNGLVTFYLQRAGKIGLRIVQDNFVSVSPVEKRVSRADL